ncbi:hypothetical protein QN277_016730 [Acacia crassicarpa]|uniref:RNase H type-1 domain-containing protein n=1 Tax=Acacia crassicarpa TaxID=499986 RepID=A0AAE1TBW5_9FABA|nr:hypothetical protein QN277_016730 [Acacia crassicarpa]
MASGIGSGGVIRGDHDNFISGFMFRGDGGDSLSAELWGCLHGLKLVWDMGFRNVILEVDSVEAVDLIKNEANEAHADWSILAVIKGLLGRDWNTELSLIRRWENSAANFLAKASLSIHPGFHVVHNADIYGAPKNSCNR